MRPLSSSPSSVDPWLGLREDATTANQQVWRFFPPYPAPLSPSFGVTQTSQHHSSQSSPQLSSLLPRLLRLTRDASSSSSSELAVAKRDADKALADLTESVAQLDDVVQAVKRDRRRCSTCCSSLKKCCNVECRYGLSQDDVDTRATFAGEIPIESKSLFNAFAANSRLQLQQHSQALSKFDGISARALLMSRDSSSSSPPSAAAAGSKANDMAFNANQLQVQRTACHHISRHQRHA